MAPEQVENLTLVSLAIIDYPTPFLHESLISTSQQQKLPR